jgi:hypothetical protein
LVKKLVKTPFSTNGWVQRHVPVIPATWGGQIGGYSQGQQGHKSRPYLKNNQHKKGWRVRTVVEHLSSKCEALSSKRRKEGREGGKKGGVREGKDDAHMSTSHSCHALNHSRILPTRKTSPHTAT